MWSNRDWVGSLFTSGNSSQSYLRCYSEVFNSVEGNTTFYALPSENTVNSWAEQAQAGFQFCFKLPRNITHGSSASAHRLDQHREELNLFFQRMEPLAKWLGPFMIQLPERFEPRYLDQLQRLIKRLPKAFSYSVEVRHPEFFNQQEQERSLNQMLHKYGIDRVCLDSRALFSRPPITPQEHDAHRKKPRLPVHAIATANRPLVRFIGCADAEHNRQYLMAWVKKIEQWCVQGMRPIVFIHTPDNLNAPQQAFAFHQMLSHLAGWQPLKRSLKNETQMTIF
jgi:uncharacterized protein YecE (DUF72 family)